jgi:hypothetical protein
MLFYTPHSLSLLCCFFHQSFAHRKELVAALGSHVEPPCGHGVKPKVISPLKVCCPCVNVLFNFADPIFKGQTKVRMEIEPLERGLPCISQGSWYEAINTI